MATTPPSKPRPQALIFDLMGTCCDWLSALLPLLETAPAHPALPPSSLPEFAASWRAGFFAEVHAGGMSADEDLDVTHARVLDRLLSEKGIGMDDWDDGVRERLVRGWHVQRGWPDVKEALERLRKSFFIVVLANGTTRLQLDIAKSSNLPFHALFSSQLLGLMKPDPAIYLKTLELLQLEPSECMMVAAHAYDLRAAKKVRMQTAYIWRTTEDLDEDMDAVRADVDIFVDGRQNDKQHGLGRLADLLI